MKISLWVPEAKDYQWLQRFLDKEIAQAGNIKSDGTKKSVLQGLNIAKTYVSPGMCAYIEGNTMTTKEYNGREFKYHCGGEFVKPAPQSSYT